MILRKLGFAAAIGMALLFNVSAHAAEYSGVGTWGNRALAYGCGDGADAALKAMVTDLGGDRLRDYAIDWAYVGMVDGNHVDCKATLIPGGSSETFPYPRREFSFSDRRVATGPTAAIACGNAEALLLYWTKFQISVGAGSGLDAQSFSRLTHSELIDRSITTGGEQSGHPYSQCTVSRRFSGIEIFYEGVYRVAEGAGSTVESACAAAVAVAQRESGVMCTARGLELNHWWTNGDRTNESGGQALCRVNYRSDCIERGGR